MEQTHNLVLNELNAGLYPTEDMSPRENALYVRQVAALNDYSMAGGESGFEKVIAVAKEVEQLSAAQGLANYALVMASIAQDHPGGHADMDSVLHHAVDLFEQATLDEDTMYSMEQMANLHAPDSHGRFMHYSEDFFHDREAGLEDRKNKVALYIHSLAKNDAPSSASPKPR